MASVLVLFASGDEQESATLRSLLQDKLGTSYNLNSIKEILAEESTLEYELSNSSCTLFVASKQSCELIKGKNKETDCGGIVMFDGEVIQKHIEEKSLSDKMVVAQLGSDEDTEIDVLKPQKVISVGGNLNDESPEVHQIVDAIKGIVSSKVSSKENEKPAKQSKKKKNCTQM